MVWQGWRALLTTRPQILLQPPHCCVTESTICRSWRVSHSCLHLHRKTFALGKALVEGERIRTLREQLEQTIQVEIRNALQSLRSAEARLRAAAAAREAGEQQYASEQRKLDAGQSTGSGIVPDEGDGFHGAKLIAFNSV